MKSVKIDIPKGYEIDKEKSTFENIVFKKVDDVIIKWDKDRKGVEIKAEGEHFILDAATPSFYCNWDDAIRYYSKAFFNWKLPTVKQLQVIAKYSNKINEVIRSNNGFEIEGWMWSRNEKGEFCAWGVLMTNGNTYDLNKRNFGYARAVFTL